MLVKDKKYAVAVSDMQGWRISEFDFPLRGLGLGDGSVRVVCFLYQWHIAYSDPAYLNRD